jgi:hypothetical protein
MREISKQQKQAAILYRGDKLICELTKLTSQIVGTAGKLDVPTEKVRFPCRYISQQTVLLGTKIEERFASQKCVR